MSDLAIRKAEKGGYLVIENPFSRQGLEYRILFAGSLNEVLQFIRDFYEPPFSE